LSSSRGGLLLSTENGESSSFPPLVESSSGELFSYYLSGVLLSSTKNGWFSSFPPLLENSPCSLRLRRIFHKRSSIGIPFIEKRF